jgi:hypothetical protein
MPLFGSNFAQGFIKGVAESVDERLKDDMDRTFKRADRAADYHIRRKAAEQERYDAEMRDVEDLLNSFAAFTGGDLDKAAQLYKAGGGSVENAKAFYTTLNDAQNKLGDDFDINRAVTFAESQAGELGMADYLGNLVRRPRDFVAASLPDSTMGGVGLFRAFQPGESIRKDIAEQVESAIPTSARNFTESEIGTASVDYGQLPTSTEYGLKMESERVALSTSKLNLQKLTKEIADLGGLTRSEGRTYWNDTKREFLNAAALPLDDDGEFLLRDASDRLSEAQEAYSKSLRDTVQYFVDTGSVGTKKGRDMLAGYARNPFVVATEAPRNDSDGTLDFRSMSVGSYYAVKYQGSDNPETFIFAGYDTDGEPIKIRVR